MSVRSAQAVAASGTLDLHGLGLRNWQAPLVTSFEVCLPFLHFICWEIIYLYYLNVELIGIRTFSCHRLVNVNAIVKSIITTISGRCD